MNNELLSNTLLIGSSIRNNPLDITPRLTIHSDYKKCIIPEAEKLLQDGLVTQHDPSETLNFDFDPALNITTYTMPWRISRKGEEKLFNLYTDPKKSAEFKSFINFFININVGKKNAIRSCLTSTYTITTFKQEILKRIDESPGNNEEKSDAKSKLEKVLEHPLLNAALGAVLEAAI